MWNWIPYYLTRPLIRFTLWKLAGKILTFQYIFLPFYRLFLNENGHGTHGWCQKMLRRTQNTIRIRQRKLKGRILFIKYVVLRFTGRQTEKETCGIQVEKHRKFGHLKYWEDAIKQMPCFTLFSFNAPWQFTPLLNFRSHIFGLLPFSWFICVFYLRLSHLRPFFEDQNSDVKQELGV